MRLVFVSNFLNHHQTCLCEQLIQRCTRFTFVATKNVDGIGFQKTVDKPYVAHYYNEDEKQRIEREILDADAVIYGECPNALIDLRMRENKLSFLFSERFFKKGTWRRFIPKTRKAVTERIVQYKDKKMYVLCASAYLSYDLSLLGFPMEKCLQWGYFPETKSYAVDELLSQKTPNSLLWCGRLLHWKHPEKAIALAKRLKKDGYAFTLTMLGGGEEEPDIRRQIQKSNVEDCVTFLGAKTPDEVRLYMESAQIFLATSDKREGWGAVIGEAMNSACAVVATKQMGSAPFLLQDGQNGCVFSVHDETALYQKVKALLDNPNETVRLAKNAYQTVTEEWNASVASEKLVELIKRLCSGESFVWENGVCSMAKRIKG